MILEHLMTVLLGLTIGLVGTSLGIGAAPFLAPILLFRYHLPLARPWALR
ncbi:MAG: hypothetical protein ACE5JN_11200 [Candidatus Methylomirabilia bacterium]